MEEREACRYVLMTGFPFCSGCMLHRNGMRGLDCIFAVYFERMHGLLLSMLADSNMKPRPGQRYFPS
jgi:hypothetical protein